VLAEPADVFSEPESTLTDAVGELELTVGAAGVDVVTLADPDETVVETLGAVAVIVGALTVVALTSAESVVVED
jgi:hypothetical protein